MAEGNPSGRGGRKVKLGLISLGCPKNLVIFYILVWGSALLTGISLSAPFWVKLYDLLTEGPLRASFITSWLEGKYLKKNDEA